MAEVNNRPLLGLGVMIFKGGKILICQRKSPLGNGEYSIPGGHIEYMESLVEAAKRETREEAGVEIRNMKLLGVFNLDMYAPKHYVTIGFTADWASGEPQVLEPDKCVDWDWYELDKVPQPVFMATQVMLDAYRNRTNFKDIDV
jgi:8-oxo-dGTP diphosphatase